MKREDVKALFPEATDEQISSFLNKVGEELNPLKKDLKSAQDEREAAREALADAQAQGLTLTEQLQTLQTQLNDKMTDEERLAAREKAAEEKEREFLLKSNQLDAKEIFVASGFFDADTIEKLVGQVAGESSELSKQRANDLVEAFKVQREAVEKATKDKLLKENPGLGGNEGGDVPKTRADFFKLSLEQQIALKEANPNILKELI